MEIERCSLSEEEIIRTLETETTLTLATCAGDRVTIRPMSHVNDGLAIYFQTGADSLKARQIRENHNVGLCVGTYQIEGSAWEQGHPLDRKNAFFAKAYEAKHPGSFRRYSAYPDEIVVRVTVRCVTQWRYIDGKPYVAKYIAE